MPVGLLRLHQSSVHDGTADPHLLVLVYMGMCIWVGVYAGSSCVLGRRTKNCRLATVEAAIFFKEKWSASIMLLIIDFL